MIKEELINYFEVKTSDLDDILDIFIRVNSGGTVLSKSDLLFSTIVANWEQAREEIEILLKNINSKGEKFNFDNDFIMRTCLLLTDCPVLFNVKNFKAENVQKIRDNWDDIKQAVKKVVDLLVEFGFNQENLTSRNAIIPIAYHIFKGGNLTSKDKEKIRIYLISSLLKLIYGGKGDQVLDAIRSDIRISVNGEYKLKSDDFPLHSLRSIKLPGEKNLSFSDEDLEGVLESQKGPYTFMVLSLLYPHLKLGQVKFHQDHMHPIAAFKDSNLKRAGIPTSKWIELKEKKDTLPNLQLLEGSENESKNKTPLIDWINQEISSNPAYKSTNFIPKVSYELTHFEEFYEARKKMLINRFKQVIL